MTGFMRLIESKNAAVFATATACRSNVGSTETTDNLNDSINDKDNKDNNGDEEIEPPKKKRKQQQPKKGTISNNDKKDMEKNRLNPQFNNYELIATEKYTIVELKEIAKRHGLNISGNKASLVRRIYYHFYFSHHVLKIQKQTRDYLCRKLKRFRGPALFRRASCTNSTDCFTMEDLDSLPVSQFFSFLDNDHFIYGFDMMTFSALLQKSDGTLRNPYTRQPISTQIIRNFRTVLRLSRLMKIPVQLKPESEQSVSVQPRTVNSRARDLFQEIDALGNYSNVNWFLSLTLPQSIHLYRHFMNIWINIADLEPAARRAICPPHGNPFSGIDPSVLTTISSSEQIKNILLNVFEKVVLSGTDIESKKLGAIYVLGTLTLVSQDAAASFPWLYDSFNWVRA